MGDWREEAIEAAVAAAIAAYAPAGVEAVKDAERLMRLDMEKGIDAAAPIIRADERERLRAQVEALPVVRTGWQEVVVYVKRSDVLALLGGESIDLAEEYDRAQNGWGMFDEVDR